MPRLNSTTVLRTPSLKEIDEIARRIAEKYHPVKIILLGSYASGIPKSDSDVDLLVIMENNKSSFDIAVEISLSLKHTFPIDIVVKTPQEIAKRLESGDFFITEIVKNGKVLYERTGS